MSLAKAIAAAYLRPQSAAVDLAEVPVGSGYAIQDEVRRLLGQGTVGYRIVANTERARRVLGIAAPLIGIVPETAVWAASTADKMRPTAVEGEFAVEVGFDPAASGDCWTIRGWRLALDLPASRQRQPWSSLTADQILADIGLLGGVMVSAPTALTTWPKGPGTLTVSGDGEEQAFAVPLGRLDEVRGLLGLITGLIRAGQIAPPTGLVFVLLGAERALSVSAETQAITLTHPQLNGLRLAL
jgi:hypothetical protein